MKFIVAVCLSLCLIIHVLMMVGGLIGESEAGAKITKSNSTKKLEKFLGLDFYQTNNNKPEYNIKAEEVDHHNLKTGNLINPEATFFQNDQEIYLKSNKGKFDIEKEKMVYLEDAVEVISPDSNLVSAKASYDLDRDILHARGSVSSNYSEYELESDELIFDRKNETVEASGGVRTKYKGYNLNCEEGKYDLKTKKFVGSGQVETNSRHSISGDRVKIKSDEIVAYPEEKRSTVKGNVSGSIQRKRKYEGKVTFKADEISADLNKEKIELNSNVELKRNNVTVTANQSKIFVQNYNKRLSYYELNGNVVIKQRLKDPKTMKKYNRMAYAEKLEGYAREKKIVLTGTPRVESKNNIVRGSKIIIKENANLVEVLDSNALINTNE